MPQPSTRSNPVRLVLTGGLGAGKSTAARRFRELGAVVIEADRVGHEVLAPDGEASGPVAARWPQVVRAGRIDRAVLARVVFADAEELSALEAITHPAIRAEIARRVHDAGTRPVVVETPVSAVLPEDEWVIVVVAASLATRLLRAVDRGLSADDAAARASHQPSDAEWSALGDHVLVNDGNVDDLRSAVDALWMVLHRP